MPTTLLGLTNVDPTVVTQIVIVSGNNQQVGINANFNPFVVQARNGLGNGVAGFSVTFTAPGSAASCKFAGALTAVVASDSSGFATTPTPVATGTTGTFTVTAAGSGVTTQNFNEKIGVPYLPEVCTPFETAGAAAVNSSLGSVSNTTQWTNPTLAAAAAAGASFASISATGFATNRTYGILALNSPASWSALKSDALLTKLQLRFSGWLTGNAQNIYLSFVRNGVIMANYNLVAASGLAVGAWNTVNMVYTVVAPPGTNSITPADLKLPNTQFLITFGWSATGTSGAQVNGVQVSVCYQDVDTSALNPRPTPLQFCEA